MAHQESKARQSQRTRQLKKPRPVRVQKRIGRTNPSAKKAVPVIKTGIPVGLAALAKQQREKRKLKESEKKKAGSQNSPFQKVNLPKFSAAGRLGALSK